MQKIIPTPQYQKRLSNGQTFFDNCATFNEKDFIPFIFHSLYQLNSFKKNKLFEEESNFPESGVSLSASVETRKIRNPKNHPIANTSSTNSNNFLTYLILFTKKKCKKLEYLVNTLILAHYKSKF